MNKEARDIVMEIGVRSAHSKLSSDQTWANSATYKRTVRRTNYTQDCREIDTLDEKDCASLDLWGKTA